MGKRALVAGATGLVGRELVERLLVSEAYDRVVALVRSGMHLTHPKLEQQIVNFDELEQMSTDLVKGSVIFCALGTTMKRAKTRENFKRADYDYPMALGRLASRHGAERMLIVTAMGANRKSLFFYSRVKGQVEADLEALGLRALHIFRPSLIVGDRREPRPGEGIAAGLAKKAPFLFMGKMKPYAPVEASKIAAAMVHVSVTANDAFRIIRSDEIALLSAACAERG